MKPNLFTKAFNDSNDTTTTGIILKIVTDASKLPIKGVSNKNFVLLKYSLTTQIIRLSGYKNKKLGIEEYPFRYLEQESRFARFRSLLDDYYNNLYFSPDLKETFTNYTRKLQAITLQRTYIIIIIPNLALEELLQ